MKRIVASIAIAAFPAIAPAQTAEQIQLCNSIGQMAAQVMQKRQDRIPMSTMIEIAMTQSGTPIGEVVYAFILEAYDVPVYNTDKYKNAAVLDFRNKAEAICFRTIDQ